MLIVDDNFYGYVVGPRRVPSKRPAELPSTVYPPSPTDLDDVVLPSAFTAGSAMDKSLAGESRMVVGAHGATPVTRSARPLTANRALLAELGGEGTLWVDVSTSNPAAAARGGEPTKPARPGVDLARRTRAERLTARESEGGGSTTVRTVATSSGASAAPSAVRTQVPPLHAGGFIDARSDGVARSDASAGASSSSFPRSAVSGRPPLRPPQSGGGAPPAVTGRDEPSARHSASARTRGTSVSSNGALPTIAASESVFSASESSGDGDDASVPSRAVSSKAPPPPRPRVMASAPTTYGARRVRARVCQWHWDHGRAVCVCVGWWGEGIGDAGDGLGDGAGGYAGDGASSRRVESPSIMAGSQASPSHRESDFGDGNSSYAADIADTRRSPVVEVSAVSFPQSEYVVAVPGPESERAGLATPPTGPAGHGFVPDPSTRRSAGSGTAAGRVAVAEMAREAPAEGAVTVAADAGVSTARRGSDVSEFGVGAGFSLPAAGGAGGGGNAVLVDSDAAGMYSLVLPTLDSAMDAGGYPIAAESARTDSTAEVDALRRRNEARLAVLEVRATSLEQRIQARILASRVYELVLAVCCGGRRPADW